MLRRCVGVAVKRPAPVRMWGLTTRKGSSSPPPPTDSSDSEAQERAKKVVVFGGSGFVGQNVCQAALKLGAEVVSVNRSGAPSGKEWSDRVRWVRSDIFEPDTYASELSGATGVISCVGAFGSDAFMEKICGDATVVAAEAAEKAGVERFVFISAAGSQHVHPFLAGYWRGKKKAEAAIEERFPDGGVILRAPGIYGNREVGSVTLPLGLIMKPAEMVLSLPPFSLLRGASALEPLFTPPVSVEVVGRVAAGGALGLVPPGTLVVDDMNRLAKTL